MFDDDYPGINSFGPLDTGLNRLERERDEAKDALIDALRDEAAMKRERDALRAALRRLRASARDYAWAEVERGELTIDMRLSLEAADEALASEEE